MSVPSPQDWMQQALLLAKKAEQMGEVPVGAVLVKDNKLLATGYNSPIAHHDASAHAEIMAIRNAGQICSNYRLLDTTLYVSLEPCAMCVGAIIHARISKVVYGATEPRTGALGGAFNLMTAHQHNHQFSVEKGLLAEQSQRLLQDFFKARRK